jgi:hypothetical protein
MDINPTTIGILQYGALGLCFIMVMLYFRILMEDKKSRKEEAVRYERMFNLMLARADSAEVFMGKFFSAMEARPCMYENGKFMPEIKRDMMTHGT